MRLGVGGVLSICGDPGLVPIVYSYLLHMLMTLTCAYKGMILLLTKANFTTFVLIQHIYVIHVEVLLDSG